MAQVTMSLEEYHALIDQSSNRKKIAPTGTVYKATVKKSRKASAYSKRYGAAFKRLQKKYKTKGGAWRKGGFKACQKAAHKAGRK